MKKLLSIILLSALALATIAQNQTIALLKPRAGDGSETLTPMEQAMVRGELRKAIVNMPGYQAITREDLDQMMTEQNFQRTGLVSNDQIKKLGEMSGADYICVSTLTKSNSEFYLEAYLIHLESGRMSNPASQYGELTNGKFANMLPVCEALAQELLGGTSKRSVQTTSSSYSTQRQEKTAITEENSMKKEIDGTKKTIILSDGSEVQLLWKDPSYPKDCRKAGEQAYLNAVMKNATQVSREVKKGGLKGQAATLKATEVLIQIASKAGNEALLQCSKSQ